jgi:hypothetical protein
MLVEYDYRENVVVLGKREKEEMEMDYNKMDK